jgi:hypothetical protein
MALRWYGTLPGTLSNASSQAGSTKWESRWALTIQWDYLSVYALRHYRADNLSRLRLSSASIN